MNIIQFVFATAMLYRFTIGLTRILYFMFDNIAFSFSNQTLITVLFAWIMLSIYVETVILSPLRNDNYDSDSDSDSDSESNSDSDSDSDSESNSGSDN